MRAQLPVPRSRRGLLIVTAVFLLVLGGAVAGVALGTSSSAAGRLTDANFRGFQIFFRYPAAWRREDWCWVPANGATPMTLLSTAPHPPRCYPYPYPLGGGTGLPPRQQLGPDGVTVWWLVFNHGGLSGAEPNARLAGKPARITVRQVPAGSSRFQVRCVGSGATERTLRARIEGPSSRIGQVLVGAVICGPDFAAGQAAVERVLESLRFT